MAARNRFTRLLARILPNFSQPFHSQRKPNKRGIHATMQA